VRRAISPPGADPELVLVDLPPGANVSYPASSYAFLRGHCVWMLSGRLVIREEDGETLLATGDLLAFDLSAPQDRAYRNPSASVHARYLVALTRR